jgi:hypothetical protein
VTHPCRETLQHSMSQQPSLDSYPLPGRDTVLYHCATGVKMQHMCVLRPVLGWVYLCLEDEGM